MKELLISKYIDNELTLKEKEIFINEILNNPQFANETIDFIEQEKLLCTQVKPKNDINLPNKKRGIYKFIPTAISAIASFIIIFFIINSNNPAQMKYTENQKEYRFVIYQPGAKTVELTGDFTKWQKVKMKPIDKTGYFELSMKLKPGEYKYSFVIDGKYTAPDPTVLAKERDDFGNENSILKIKGDV